MSGRRAAGSAPAPATATSADAWALFLDVDGTLLDLAPHPDAVTVDSDLLALLDLLETRLSGALALVSGRPIAGIDRLFGPRRFAAAGLHGVEWRRAGGVATRRAASADLTDVAAVLEARLGAIAGVLLEPKGPTLAVHYRMAPAAEALVRGAAREAVGALGGAYRLLEGHMVVELVPRTAGKGGAIEAFMALPPFAGRQPVFLGDDVTDESGFAAVNASGGLSIRVGPPAPTVARYALPDPSVARDWLTTLLRAMPAPHGG